MSNLNRLEITPGEAVVARVARRVAAASTGQPLVEGISSRKRDGWNLKVYQTEVSKHLSIYVNMQGQKGLSSRGTDSQMYIMGSSLRNEVAGSLAFEVKLGDLQIARNQS